ncbi:ATP-binding protein [Parafrankia elaeagni]|uniref:ATP-binding protein n=1 Tax=Parafrankia elaeagni TaxID=222534 RepID=UPI000475C732
MEIKLGLSLPRDEISIPIVRRICAQALKVLGVSQDCIEDVEIALTEACANVLIHATADDEYEVSVGVDNTVAVIEVVDHGSGLTGSFGSDDGFSGSDDGFPGSDGDGDGGPHGPATRKPDWNEPQGPDPSMLGPTELLPEQGRGILLMRALMDNVRFDAVDGPLPGTRVHLEKLLTWNKDHPGRRLHQIPTHHGPWSGRPRQPPDQP